MDPNSPIWRRFRRVFCLVCCQRGSLDLSFVYGNKYGYIAMGKLTARKVATLSEAGMHNDGQGLYLQITPPNGKSWILRTQVRGKKKDIGLGSAHLFTLAEAREEAHRLRRIARSGGDPLAERRRETITFEEAARKTYEANLPSWKNGKHVAQWISSLEMYVFPKLGDKTIEALGTGDILETLTPIWHEKAETARRVRQRIGTVFTWAKAAGHYPYENPINAVTKEALGKQADRTKHHDAMPWQDVPAFFAAIAQKDANSAKALQFAILCASRPNEVRFACWEEIDLDNAVWVIPAERMKGTIAKAQEHRVPLSPAAIEVLESLNGTREGFVFTSPTRGKNCAQRAMSENAMISLLKRMEVKGVTAHGFRTSFRTWGQEKSRADHDVLERCLAHAVGNAVSQAYARSDLLEQRRPVMEAWGRFVSGIYEAKIVQLTG